MFVTFTRCEWRGGSRRLIKAAGMLIGRGHCCPLCSARSYWASVAPVKGQRTDLKSVTLTPHTLRHPPHTHTQLIPPTTPPPCSSPPIISSGFFLPHSRRKWTPLLLSFPPCCLIRWLALPSPLGLIQCWGSNFITVFFSRSCGHTDGCTSSQMTLRWGEVREVSKGPNGISVMFYCWEILNKWARKKKSYFLFWYSLSNI